MQCLNCKTKLPPKAKFCPECGVAVTAETELKVRQEIGNVKGDVVGTALDDEALPSNLRSSTTQKVESVEKGGTVVGTVLGKDAQVSGQRQYGDVVKGDKITTGDIKGNAGVAIGHDMQVNVTQGASAEEIAKAFSTLLSAVQAMPDSPEKTAVQAAVQGLEAEAVQGEQADESEVQKWFSFLGEMAPDVWEVAVDTFINPVKGISTVFKKVAERAKAEKGK